MLRTILIDDEAHNRDTLRKLLEQNCPQVRVVGEAPGVQTGIKLIRELIPELVFLDINMKDGTGFDLLNSFSSIDFEVIFVSAFDARTIQTIKLPRLEYLAKPVDPEKLVRAVKYAEQEHRRIISGGEEVRK